MLMVLFFSVFVESTHQVLFHVAGGIQLAIEFDARTKRKRG
jgi:hypothetical protein